MRLFCDELFQVEEISGYCKQFFDSQKFGKQIMQLIKYFHFIITLVGTIPIIHINDIMHTSSLPDFIINKENP